MRVGAVIAAAGVPGGFAAYEKIEHTDGADMVKRMIQVFHQAGVEDVAVVTGYKARETEKSLSKLGAVFLRSSDYAGEERPGLSRKKLSEDLLLPCRCAAVFCTDGESHDGDGISGGDSGI